MDLGIAGKRALVCAPSRVSLRSTRATTAFGSAVHSSLRTRATTRNPRRPAAAMTAASPSAR